MSNFSQNLVDRYLLTGRDLPWRTTRNPYFIWLSEIILQQTRVDQGMSYYLKFIEHYPTVEALATAPEDEVLRLWQGLGYYSRARNLHFTAKYIHSSLGGIFPNNFKDLCTLKGVGEYTAAAIASFAYNEAVPVVDGNVYRVLARYLNIENDISASGTKKVFFEASAALMQGSRPSDYNQAIMELGATICKPQNPDCGECPVAEGCAARQLGIQHLRPVKTKKTKVKSLWLLYAVPVLHGKIAMRKRGVTDIWRGLYDFHCYTFEEMGTPAGNYLASALPLPGMKTGKEYIAEKHQLSHRTLLATFVPVDVSDVKEPELTAWLNANGLAFYTPAEAEKLPKPVLIKNFLDKFVDLLTL